jgi:hypothetical protein
MADFIGSEFGIALPELKLEIPPKVEFGEVALPGDSKRHRG